LSLPSAVSAAPASRELSNINSRSVLDSIALLHRSDLPGPRSLSNDDKLSLRWWFANRLSANFDEDRHRYLAHDGRLGSGLC